MPAPAGTRSGLTGQMQVWQPPKPGYGYTRRQNRLLPVNGTGVCQRLHGFLHMPTTAVWTCVNTHASFARALHLSGELSPRPNMDQCATMVGRGVTAG